MSNEYADSVQGVRNLLADGDLDDAQIERMKIAPDQHMEGVWAAVDPQEYEAQYLCYVSNGDVEEVRFDGRQLVDIAQRNYNE